MLDSFLEVSYAKTKHAQEMDRRVELMKRLPSDLLFKIASGEEKIGYPIGLEEGAPKTWLDRFKDTPLFEQALEIEKQELENRLADKERRRADRLKWDAQDAARDELCIRRKMLELQLAEVESGGGAAAAEEAPPEEPAVVGGGEAATEAPEEPAKTAGMELLAARMKTAARTLREVEEETRQRGREAGKKWGRKRGARAGGVRGGITGGLGGGAAGALFGRRRALAALGGAAAGGLVGGGFGAGKGAVTGGRIGARLGEAEAQSRNIQRRHALYARLMRQRAQELQHAKTSSVEMDKEAVTGLLAAGKGLFKTMKSGWGGKGLGKKQVFAPTAGTRGLEGAMSSGKQYYAQLAKKSPGAAAGLAATGAAIPAFGAGAMV
jgi:hypothetical protein